MHLIALHDKATIAAFLQRNPLLQLYELGDLDPFFWPQTVWYGLHDGAELRQVALLYTAPDVPVLLANPVAPRDTMRPLLERLLPLLPRRIYAHLDATLIDVLAASYTVEPYGAHLKLGLTAPERLTAIATAPVVQFGPQDRTTLEAFYAASYPDNWFAARMLETKRYYGIYADGNLASVAGVHVYSREFSAATLGNVTTHPAYRGRGYAKHICAQLCHALRDDGIQHIGLNVKADNAAAIAAYQALGFTIVAEYAEYLLS